ncbi:MAG: DNA polymerase III subunit delta [Deltaproteobacteria bacterium]
MSAGGELAGALEEIRAGKARPVYLLEGDEFLCRQAGKELAEALVPEASRDLNLVLLDAGASARRVADELRTVPMFRGQKAVFVQPCEFLAPKKAARGNPFAKVRELWAGGKQREAARRLLALAGRLGFPLPELAGRSRDDWEAAGVPLEQDDLAVVAGAAELAAAEGLEIPEGDTRALEALLEAGLPPGHHLVAAVEELDRSSALCKRCLASGLVIERALGAAPGAKGRPGPVDIRALSQEILGPLGKALAPEAARLLVSRAGDDARTLASELDKLSSYVGEKKTIDAKDVEAIVPQAVGEDYFALTNALEARDGKAMLAAIESELSQDGVPLRLLAGLASGVRGLLQVRCQLGEGARALSYPEFERRVWPKLLESDKAAGRKSGSPYRAFKRAEGALRYGRRELAGAIVLIAEADRGIKRGMDGAGWLTRIAVRLAAPAGRH